MKRYTQRSYQRSLRSGQVITIRPWLNPMVCVCPEPQADPAVNFGECAVCRRPHLSCFRSLREAS